ncbi:MAG: PAS domain S-box protein, partial [Anaerolineae bacterium]
MKQKATPSGTDLSRPGREVDLLLVLNAAAASLQRSAHSEADVFRAVREEVVGLGLYGGVSLLDERGERLVICAFADPDHTLARLEKLTGLKAEGFEFAVAGVDVYRQVVETGETVFVPDNSAVVAQLIPEAVRPFAGRILKAFGPMPALYAPLMAEERVQGTLNVAGAGLAPDDVPAMEAFAHHISVALENARLFAAMQQAYERLKESEARFRKLSRAVEQSPTSVLITNTDGIIEYVNPQFTQITGYVPEEVIGKTPRILKSGEHPPEFYQELWDTISSGKEWQGDICNRKKNGELYWELQSISPIRSVAGEITHFLAVRIDDTERKRTEEAL